MEKLRATHNKQSHVKHHLLRVGGAIGLAALLSACATSQNKNNQPIDAKTEQGANRAIKTASSLPLAKEATIPISPTALESKRISTIEAKQSLSYNPENMLALVKTPSDRFIADLMIQQDRIFLEKSKTADDRFVLGAKIKLASPDAEGFDTVSVGISRNFDIKTGSYTVDNNPKNNFELDVEYSKSSEKQSFTKTYRRLAIHYSNPDQSYVVERTIQEETHENNNKDGFYTIGNVKNVAGKITESDMPQTLQPIRDTLQLLASGVSQISYTVFTSQELRELPTFTG